MLEAGFTPVILDDFSSSKPAVLERLQSITGQPVLCQQGSVADVALVQDLIHRHQRPTRALPVCPTPRG